MARNEITFQVNLRQNENTTSRAYGNYYFEAETKEPLSLKGFARHLAEHGKLATYEMLVLVLQNVVSCMKELVTQGQPVKLDGLGIFYPTITAVSGGYVSPQELMDNLRDSIKGVNIRFRPEGAGESNEKITSTAMKDRCTFQAGYYVAPVYDGNKYLGVKKTNLNAPVVPTPPEP
jgi:hypothetical protein